MTVQRGFAYISSNTRNSGFAYPALLIIGLLVIAVVVLTQSSPLSNEVQVQGVSTGK